MQARGSKVQRQEIGVVILDEDECSGKAVARNFLH